MRSAKKPLSPYIPIDNIYIVCYNYLCHYDCCVIQLNDIIAFSSSGRTSDLESDYIGSNPVEAVYCILAKLVRHFTLNEAISGSNPEYTIIYKIRSGGGIGRHGRFRFYWLKGHEGSNPSLSIWECDEVGES